MATPAEFRPCCRDMTAGQRGRSRWSASRVPRTLRYTDGPAGAITNAATAGPDGHRRLGGRGIHATAPDTDLPRVRCGTAGRTRSNHEVGWTQTCVTVGAKGRTSPADGPRTDSGIPLAHTTVSVALEPQPGALVLEYEVGPPSASWFDRFGRLPQRVVDPHPRAPSRRCNACAEAAYWAGVIGPAARAFVSGRSATEVYRQRLLALAEAIALQRERCRRWRSQPAACASHDNAPFSIFDMRSRHDHDDSWRAPRHR